MKQVVSNLKAKKVEVREVSAPTMQAGGLLVANRGSLISTGTERSAVQTGEKSLLGKARARPDLVQRIVDFAQREGVVSAYRLVRDRLDSWQPLGYSSAGEVIDPGDCLDEFRRGDRVACAGVGYACHAEITFVPRNLCVRIPDNVDYEQACFTTLSAIALQGIRQGEVVLGDVVLVTGLGLVGLLTVQLLKATGAKVIGLDLEPERLQQARDLGADAVSHPDDPELEGVVAHLTLSRGVDVALLTASTDSSAPAIQAAHLLRDRGALVIVGAVGTDLPRNPFYEKELSVRYSRSYGPGRYDPGYEEKGHDYPVGYVRWTERRNMEAVLSLMAQDHLKTADLISHHFPVEQAPAAYQLLKQEKGGRALAIVLTYPRKEATTSLSSVTSAPAEPTPRCVVGWIGPGKFAQRALLPHFRDAEGVELRLAASATGLSATRISERFGFTLPAADIDDIMRDESINTVVITTQHDSHTDLAIRALEAGKENIFLEKPLAISIEGLEEVTRTLQDHSGRLLVGFNRRFAPATVALKKALEGRTSPCHISCRINAGYIAADHWTQDPERGGGRLLGEVCHFTDLLVHLVGAPAASIAAMALLDAGGQYLPEDNLSCVMHFADGSTANLTYLANGPQKLPKERIEVFAGGRAFLLDDFRQVDCIGRSRRTLWKGARVPWKAAQDKGHEAEVKAFIQSIRDGLPSPIPADELLASSRLPFLVREALQTGETVWL